MICTPTEALEKRCRRRQLEWFVNRLPACAASMKPGEEGSCGRRMIVGFDTDAQKMRQKCEGSICMDWRWTNAQHTHGFCGLSGTPPERAQEAAVKLFEEMVAVAGADADADADGEELEE